MFDRPPGRRASTGQVSLLAAVILLSIALLALDARGGIGLITSQLALLRTPAFTVPAGWPQPVYDFRDNPITAAGFALGRELFHDPKLSRDGSVSCASCHQQFAAFAHYDHAVSHGIDNRNGARNAPGLFNLAWLPQLMWDGGAHNLEVQPLGPIANPVEMDAKLPALLDRLRADPAYPKRFEAAFGTPDIDSQRMLKALAQFTGTMISADSRYDRYVGGDASALNATEQAGLAAFRTRCASCHVEPLFSDFSYRDNGLDAAPRDAGRATVTAREVDRGSFRVPSLRNIGLTPPYMHDGRFDTLAQVIDHYRSGVASSDHVDPLLRAGLPISDAERAALLAFLPTLDDAAFTHDLRFADPARRR